ncbi:hypothetical protein J4441_04135 [Candidatus Micrarchaeota archaeon]|nr:hypothetical protein [Candidatus Micrarchaeota archaeon]
MGEYFRLGQIEQARNLTLEDLARMGELTGTNAGMHGEFLEAQWMAQHGYSQHVMHSLQSIYTYAKWEEEACPAHQLWHAGIFLQFNETHMAEHAIEEGKEQLGEWDAMAMEKRAQNPQTYPQLEEILSAMEREISAFEAGDYATAVEKAKYIGENGYC